MKRHAILLVMTLVFTVALAPAAGASAERMPVTTSSDEARILYYDGWRYIDSGQTEKARPLFEKAVALDPKFVLGYLGLAWSQPRFKDMFEFAGKAVKLRETADISEAERIYIDGAWASLNADMDGWVTSTEKLADMFPQDARAQYDRGNAVLFGRTDPAGALEHLENAASVDPAFTPVHNSLGWCHRQLGSYDKAEKSYKLYIELAPENPAAHDAFAALLLKLGRFDEATNSYRQALHYDPMYVSSHQGICTTLMLDDKHDEARSHIRSLYDKAPNDGIRSGIHFATAVIYADEGRLDDALGELEKNYALSEKIQDVVAMRIDLNNAGRVLLEMGRHDEAMVKYEKALDLALQSDQTEQRKEAQRIAHVYRQGTFALAKGRIDEARGHAKDLSEKAASFGNIFITQVSHQLLGMIALETGRYDEAIDEFMKSNSGDAYNMYRMALAFEGKGDDKKMREMLTYVVEYRGVLNLNYAFVRHIAKTRLNHPG